MRVWLEAEGTYTPFGARTPVAQPLQLGDAPLLVRRTALHTPAQVRVRACPLAAADDLSTNQDNVSTVVFQACITHPSMCSEAAVEVKPGIELEV